jgi:hypothetical protein
MKSDNVKINKIKNKAIIKNKTNLKKEQINRQTLKYRKCLKNPKYKILLKFDN